MYILIAGQVVPTRDASFEEIRDVLTSIRED